MADKKMTAAEKKAAAEAAAQAAVKSKVTERQRLIGAGAVLAAVALFVGGYAVGNASDDDAIIGSKVVVDEPEDRRGPFDDRPGRDGDRPGDRFPGPTSRFDFEFPEGFEFPDDFDFPSGPRDGFDFDFLDDFEIPREGGAFGFGFECSDPGDHPGGIRCEFTFPDDFEFPEGFGFRRGPFSGDEFPPEASPPADEIPAESGFLGVEVVDGPDGITVVGIFPGSAADVVGIATDDVIVAVDRVDLRFVEDLATAITRSGAGTEVTITVIRDGQEERLAAVLGPPPS